MSDVPSLELHAGVAGLRGLEREWWELWRQDDQATAFQSPAWLIPWAEAFQPDAAFAACLRREGAVAAILPMFVFEEDGPRRLLPLGAGTTDWLGPVCRPDARPIDLATLLAEVALDRGVEQADLPQLSPGSLLARAVAPPGWRAERAAGTPSPAVDLPADLPKSLRQNLRTARNRLERTGRVEIAQAGGESLTAAIERLFDLHAARWDGDGGGVLADPAVRRFHQLAAGELERAGLLRLYTLALDGNVIAALHGLRAKGRFHYYIGGYDPAHEHGSPGNLLIAHALEQATADGCRLFDFLRGQEDYKYRWGATDRESVSVTMRAVG
ncbi:GNAT family N-acetyltransferase [Indioceanicola profundi]|uniref:GNAT family N-acetyltransferase n=1 Tax=Indioceanicola profundi TaxID=2220096 RepID=UPI000E6ACB54|nr:GNAT family N-acetyltransferase [Indioceanicola profundi]